MATFSHAGADYQGVKFRPDRLDCLAAQLINPPKSYPSCVFHGIGHSSSRGLATHGKRSAANGERGVELAPGHLLFIDLQIGFIWFVRLGDQRPGRGRRALRLAFSWQSWRGVTGCTLAQGLASELNAMRAVQEPVENGVSHGGFAQRFVPQRNPQLAGEDGRTEPRAVSGLNLESTAPETDAIPRPAPCMPDHSPGDSRMCPKRSNLPPNNWLRERCGRTLPGPIPGA